MRRSSAPAREKTRVWLATIPSPRGPYRIKLRDRPRESVRPIPPPPRSTVASVSPAGPNRRPNGGAVVNSTDAPPRDTAVQRARDRRDAARWAWWRTRDRLRISTPRPVSGARTAARMSSATVSSRRVKPRGWPRPGGRHRRHMANSGTRRGTGECTDPPVDRSPDPGGTSARRERQAADQLVMS